MSSSDRTGYDFLAEKPGFSSKAIDRLGKYLAGKRDKPEPAASKIFSWYNNLACEMALAAEREAITLFDPPNSHTSFRVKSATTISDKLRRGSIQLSKMQDFAGARLTINCLHDGLRQLGDRLTEQISAAGHSVEQKDYLDTPQQGYRALHLWVRGSAGKVELQLRTLLQSEWANAFEQVAALTGRRIRYEEGYEPEDPALRYAVLRLLQMSDDIYELEQQQGQNQSLTKQVLTRLAEMPIIFPTTPEVHDARLESLEQLMVVENAQIKMAGQVKKMVEILRRYAYLLENYEQDPSPGEGTAK